MSETQKYLALTQKYCWGNGVDVGTGGYAPVVPHAISVELPRKEFEVYTGGRPPAFPINWQGYGDRLPFKDGTLDFVYSSHLLEDFLDWWPLLREWTRVLQCGGVLVVLIPDKEKWNYAVQHLGQPVNCAHKHEGRVGELSSYAAELGLEVIEDRLTALTEHDYSILFAARRVR